MYDVRKNLDCAFIICRIEGTVSNLRLRQIDWLHARLHSSAESFSDNNCDTLRGIVKRYIFTTVHAFPLGVDAV